MSKTGPETRESAHAARLEQLLACFQKALNHDLPNQLVAVQGLVHLLDHEEKARLSLEGREYLERLCGSARRSLDTILVLRDLQKLTSGMEAREAVALADIVAEAVAEIKPLFPTVTVECRHAFQEPVVPCVRQSLLRALVQLGRLCVALARGPQATLEIGSRLNKETGEILISMAEKSRSGPGAGPLAGAEKRYEFLVARLLAENWGGGLTQEESATGPRFVLRIPQ